MSEYTTLQELAKNINISKEACASITVDVIDPDYEAMGKDSELFLLPSVKKSHIVHDVSSSSTGILIEVMCGKKFFKKKIATKVLIADMRFGIQSLMQKDFHGSNICEECIHDMFAEFKSGTGKAGTYSSSFSAYNVVECHKGTKKVFETDTLQFFAGGINRAVDLTGVDVVINCSQKPIADGSLVKVYAFGMPVFPPFKALEMTSPFHVIDINWPDYGVPQLQQIFWIALQDSLSKFGDAFFKQYHEKARVVIICAGGHGRSGTAASILTSLFGKWEKEKYDDVIAQVRAVYCDKVVESDEQVKYIATITGAEMKSKACKPIYGDLGYHAKGTYC